MSRDFRAEITEKIISMLETDGLKWLKQWKTHFPVSAVTGKEYKGINTLMLMFTQEKKGYKSNLWLTFNEARKRGGFVKQGEKATPIFYYQMIERKETVKGKEEIKTFPMLRAYFVFNMEQTSITIESEESKFSPIENAESIISGYKDKPEIVFSGSQPYYTPTEDKVVMPKPEDFTTPEAYYMTLFHELTHSTGAKKRLNRELSTKFGSEAYAYEELIAELASAFLSAKSGVIGESLQNNTAYIQGWIKILRGDKNAIFKASKQAQQAYDYMLGVEAQPKQAEQAE